MARPMPKLMQGGGKKSIGALKLFAQRQLDYIL
jgi:hypothetical protein